MRPEQAAGLYVAFVKDTLAAVRKIPGAEVAPRSQPLEQSPRTPKRRWREGSSGGQQARQPPLCGASGDAGPPEAGPQQRRAPLLEIAYAAATSHPNLKWLEDTVPVPFFLQHGADLGSRLTKAFKHAFQSGAKKVIIIGSDTPHLDPKDISEAFNLLGSRDAVLGPAKDGGYYLIGLKSPNPALFNGISWSTSQVLKQTLERINHQKLSLGLLPSYSDIDTPADLEMLERLSRNGHANKFLCTSQALRGLREFK
ncbi:MAG: TIGR04282 family arsenosugar biosynthesis glycosyltransferase [Elusimicrobia bacterium]|nr:TIGR04282 family arsenosugar biosynthesis glycosyltransferase [Elusimicrobiota bacterium]